jgi:hypothetical protein
MRRWWKTGWPIFNRDLRPGTVFARREVCEASPETSFDLHQENVIYNILIFTRCFNGNTPWADEKGTFAQTGLAVVKKKPRLFKPGILLLTFQGNAI